MFRDERGNLSELILVAPLLLGLFFFLFDLSAAAVTRNAVHAAAREAARQYSRYESVEVAVLRGKETFRENARGLGELKRLSVIPDGDVVRVEVEATATDPGFRRIWQAFLGPAGESGTIRRMLLFPKEAVLGEIRF